MKRTLYENRRQKELKKKEHGRKKATQSGQKKFKSTVVKNIKHSRDSLITIF